jgi:uncharacterized protein YgiM (DUF1202 family)
MKKRISILLCLVFFSLACMATAARIDEPIKKRAPGATTSPEVNTPTTSPQLCAVVIAETAAHLRNDASARARILDHLQSGEEVRLLEGTGAEWWHVKRGEQEGFVKAVYLKESECVK